IHQFVETRFDVGPDVNPYKSYLEWLDDPSHWLLKDPKLKADYDEYLRNGPGRWLTNSFDTTDPKEWADAKSLEAIGKLVDSEYDQAKFRDWLKDYVERNKINSRNIDDEIEKLVAPANQRFFSIWQAEPFLGDRDVNVRRYYFGEIYRRMRFAGMIFFGSLVFLYLVTYLVGPTAITAGWIARSLKLSSAAGAIGRFRERYYATPERAELGERPYYE